MIEVLVRHKETGVELARIEIECIETEQEGILGTYSVRYGVERIKSVAMLQRVVRHFPRLRLNVLGLLQAALDELEFNDMLLDEKLDPDTSTGMLRNLPTGSIFRRM